MEGFCDACGSCWSGLGEAEASSECVEDEGRIMRCHILDTWSNKREREREREVDKG